MTHDSSVADFYEIASEWLARQQDSEHWSAHDQHALEQWLHADPRHQKAYEEVTQTWQLFDYVPRPEPLTASTSLQTEPQPSLTFSHPRQKTGLGQRLRQWCASLRLPVRTTMGAALSLTVILGVAGYYWYASMPEFSESIQTARAEQRAVTLPDGTVVTVNTDSNLRVQFYPHQREVQLLQGEAYFAVAPQGDHSFIVKAANTEIRVVGTAFNVRAAPSNTYIAVNEGVVEVSSPNHTTTLRAGHAVTINLQTGQQQHSTLPPELVGSWKTGQLSFKNTPLYEVIEALQPYADKPISLANPRLGHHKVSGFANTTNPVGFLNALTQLLPVDVRETEQNTYLITPK